MNGQLCAKFGYRLVMITAMFFMIAFIFVVFFAQNVATLLVGQILCGFSWGVFATVGPAYASEVTPVNLRGYLTTYVNLCWAIGQFIAAGVLYSLINRPDQWSYRKFNRPPCAMSVGKLAHILRRQASRLLSNGSGPFLSLSDAS